MQIVLAESPEQVAACYPVMAELRPHLDAAEFARRVALQRGEGYRLAAGIADGEVVAVAGFRLAHNLAWGRFLYVDDLVTTSTTRSRGHGAAMLAWLHEQARAEGCDELHLDSGVQRKDAHRFYHREGMTFSSHHFVTRLD